MRIFVIELDPWPGRYSYLLSIDSQTGFLYVIEIHSVDHQWKVCAARLPDCESGSLPLVFMCLQLQKALELAKCE